MDRLEKEAAGHRERIRATISALSAPAFNYTTPRAEHAERPAATPRPSREELQRLLDEASNVSDVSK
jgi:hypothetical protein